MGLSRIFIGIALVVIVLIVGLSVFPFFHTQYRELPLTYEVNGVAINLPPLISALVRFSPYLLLFIIGYAAYIVWRKRGG